MDPREKDLEMRFRNDVEALANELDLISKTEATELREAFEFGLRHLDQCRALRDGALSLLGQMSRKKFREAQNRWRKRASSMGMSQTDQVRTLAHLSVLFEIHHSLFFRHDNIVNSSAGLMPYVLFGLHLRLWKLKKIKKEQLLRILTSFRLLLNPQPIDRTISQSDTEATRALLNRTKKLLNGKDPFSRDFEMDTSLEGPVHLSGKAMQPLLEFLKSDENSSA